MCVCVDSYFELKGLERFSRSFSQNSPNFPPFQPKVVADGGRQETDTQDLIGRIQLLGWQGLCLTSGPLAAI